MKTLEELDRMVNRVTRSKPNDPAVVKLASKYWNHRTEEWADNRARNFFLLGLASAVNQFG